MAANHAHDAQLLARVAAGDADAFSEFYRAHLDALVAYFARRVTASDLAFDLAAETFAAVVVNAGTFSATGPAIGWLYGIARNKLLESLRRGRVEDAARRRLALEPIQFDDADIESVDQRAELGGAALDRELEALPELTRQALLARVVDEREYEEIAGALGCSQQVVRQRVHRGLAHLRTAFQENQ